LACADARRSVDGGAHAGLRDVGLGAVAAKASAALINAAIGPKTRPVRTASSSLNNTTLQNATLILFKILTVF
jgi:hypothetical protein